MKKYSGFKTFIVYSFVGGKCVGRNYFQGVTWKGLMKHLSVRKRDGELRYGRFTHYDYVDIYCLDGDKEVFVKSMNRFKSLPMA